MIRTWISRVCKGLFKVSADDDNIEFCDKFLEDSKEKTVPGPPLTGEEAMTFVGSRPPPISEEQFLKELTDRWGTWEDLVGQKSTKVEVSYGVLDLPSVE